MGVPLCHIHTLTYPYRAVCCTYCSNQLLVLPASHSREPRHFEHVETVIVSLLCLPARTAVTLTDITHSSAATRYTLANDDKLSAIVIVTRQTLTDRLSERSNGGSTSSSSDSGVVQSSSSSSSSTQQRSNTTEAAEAAYAA